MPESTSPGRLPTASVLAVGPGGTPTWATAVALKQAAGQHDATVDPGGALALWVGQLLFRELPESQEAVGGFLTAVTTAVPGRDTWKLLASVTIPGPTPPPALVITGISYLGLTGVNRVWELTKVGRWVDAVPEQWLESRVFNLRTLYQSLAAKAERHATNSVKARKTCTTTPPPASGPTPTPPPSASSPSASTGTSPGTPGAE